MQRWANECADNKAETPIDKGDSYYNAPRK